MDKPKKKENNKKCTVKKSYRRQINKKKHNH